MSFILLLAAVVLTPLALAVLFPEGTERVYNFFDAFRTAIGALALVVFVPLFVSTGSIELILFAGLMTAYAVWKVWFDDDTEFGA